MRRRRREVKTNILVLGASSNTGRQFVNMALQRGHRVTALVRSAASLDVRTGLEVIQGDVLDPSVLEHASRGMDAIASCLGIRKENPADPWSPLLSPEDFTERCAVGIVDAMKANGIRRVVTISSAGVGDSWDAADPELREVIQTSSVGKIFHDLRNMDQVLENSALDTLAVRPGTLVTGDASGATYIIEKFEKTSRITTGDVAQWMLDAVERRAAFARRTKMIGASSLP